MDRNVDDTLRAAFALAAAAQHLADNSDSESEAGPSTPTSSEASTPGDDGQQKEEKEKTKPSISTMKRSEDASDKLLKKGASIPGLREQMPRELRAHSARRRKFLENEITFARNSFPRPDITDETNVSLCRKGLPIVVNLHQSFVEHDHPADDVGLEFLDVILDGAWFLCEDGYRPEAVPLLHTAERICSAKLPQQRLEVKELYPDVLRLLSIYESFEGIKGRHKASRRLAVALMMQIGSDILHHPTFDVAAGGSKGKKTDDLNTEKLLMLMETARLGNRTSRTTNHAKEKRAAGLGADHGCVSMQQDEMQDGESPFMTAFRIWGNNFIPMQISSIFLRYGQRGTARASLESGIKHLVNSLGPDSHHTLWFKFLKAVCLLNIGDLDASFALHTKVYEGRRTKLGEAHHETLSSRYHVAVGYHLTGDLGVAEEHLRQILEHSTTSLQWREEDLARASFRLSLILKQQDKVEEAVELAKKARDLQSKWAELIPKEVGQGFSDNMAEMARFDYGVYLWHGRTAGVWTVGEYW